MGDKPEQKKFHLSFKKTGAKLCLCHINDMRQNGNKWQLILRNKEKQYNSLPEGDRDVVFVTSLDMEPTEFYWDDKYLKCAKTNKMVCCFGHKNECSGGSILFLSNDESCAIRFTGLNRNSMMHFSKSMIYPGFGHHGGGFLLPAESKLELDKNPVIAYHMKELAPEYVMEELYL